MAKYKDVVYGNWIDAFLDKPWLMVLMSLGFLAVISSTKKKEDE